MTHPRHYLQQSRYSLCVGVWPQPDGKQTSVDYKFLAHEDLLNSGTNNDIVDRILIPATDRTIALAALDTMGINPYPVFGSEDALIRALARREMLFKDH